MKSNFLAYFDQYRHARICTALQARLISYLDDLLIIQYYYSINPSIRRDSTFSPSSFCLHSSTNMPSTFKQLKIKALTRNMLLAKWSDGLYYSAQIDKFDVPGDKCFVRFDDGVTSWCLRRDVHLQLPDDYYDKYPTEDIVCCVCQEGSTKPENNIIMCDVCQQGYHQACHNPPILSEVLTPAEDDEWVCSICDFICEQPSDDIPVKKTKIQQSKLDSPKKKVKVQKTEIRVQVTEKSMKKGKDLSTKASKKAFEPTPKSEAQPSSKPEQSNSETIENIRPAVPASEKSPIKHSEQGAVTNKDETVIIHKQESTDQDIPIKSANLNGIDPKPVEQEETNKRSRKQKVYKSNKIPDIESSTPKKAKRARQKVKNE